MVFIVVSFWEGVDFTCTYCHNLQIKCLVRLCFISDKPGISVIYKVGV